MITPVTLYPHHPVLQYPLLRTPDRMDWAGSPEWFSLPSGSASPLRSRPPVPIRPCGSVDDGIDESEARAAGARTSLDYTPAKLRSPPIPNPRRPHQGGFSSDNRAKWVIWVLCTKACHMHLACAYVHISIQASLCMQVTCLWRLRAVQWQCSGKNTMQPTLTCPTCALLLR